MAIKFNTKKAENEAWQEMRMAWLTRLFNQIEAAYKDGMTIVEIKKALGSKTVKSVLKTLVYRKVIPSIPAQSARAQYKIPSELSYGMARVGYPFFQWCLVNGFDPKAAAAGLRKDPEDCSTDLQRRVHLIASHDFPVAYSNDYSTEPPKYIHGYAREHTKPSLALYWSDKEQLYVAIAEHDSSLKTCGKNLVEAFDRIRLILNIEKQLSRLESAMTNFNGTCANE